MLKIALVAVIVYGVFATALAIDLYRQSTEVLAVAKAASDLTEEAQAQVEQALSQTDKALTLGEEAKDLARRSLKQLTLCREEQDGAS